MRPCGCQVTILREHAQGLNSMLFVLPTGGSDPRKHASHLDAAKAELSEEVSCKISVPVSTAQNFNFPSRSVSHQCRLKGLQSKLPS
jgi:hypothetical protein